MFYKIVKKSSLNIYSPAVVIPQLVDNAESLRQTGLAPDGQ